MLRILLGELKMRQPGLSTVGLIAKRAVKANGSFEPNESKYAVLDIS